MKHHFIQLFKTKPPLQDVKSASNLKRCLNGFDLTLLGIGAIIGAGVFVLTGIAAATRAGPAISLSFVVAGIACAFSALAYAELASSIGGCGSAYNYAYAGFGELVAWLIGWDLLLEYAVSCSAVAVGWSGYFNNMLMAMGIHIPSQLLHSPLSGGWINLPAMGIVLFLTFLLFVGIKQSARFNAIIVMIKLAVIALFIAIASFHINPSNWHPFMPFGWEGVMSGAALIFFAYIGFDAVSTAVEETINPRTQVPMGIIISLVVCTILYIVVSGLLTGIVPYTTLNVSSPIADALLRLGYHFAAGTIAVGAIAGLTTVILVMFYGLSRVFLAMSRDGLLPPLFAKVNERTHTPVRIIIMSGVLMSLFAGLIPMHDLAELVNIGTLAAFILVCGGVVILRYTQPNLPRHFKAPGNPYTSIIGAVFCFYLMLSLPLVTWLRFFSWMALGCVFYFSYSYFHSHLRQDKS